MARVRLTSLVLLVLASALAPTAVSAAGSGLVADERATSVSASFADDTVVAEAPTTQATLVVTAPNDDEVLLTAERFTTEQLAAIVDGTATENGVRVAVPESGEIPLRIPYDTFCTLDPERTPSVGNFSFTVRGTESLQSDTATLQVGAPPGSPQTILEDSVPIDQHGRAVVVIEQDRSRCGDRTWVAVEHGNGTAVVNATVSDRNDDGRITVRFDVRNLTRTPEAAVTAEEPDDVEDVRPERPTGEPRLPPGTYHVRIEQDLAVLTIDESETQPPATTPTTNASTTTATPTSSTTSPTTPTATAASPSPTTAPTTTVVTTASPTTSPTATTTRTQSATAQRADTTPVTGPGFTAGAAGAAVLAAALVVAFRRR